MKPLKSLFKSVHHTVLLTLLITLPSCLSPVTDVDYGMLELEDDLSIETDVDQKLDAGQEVLDMQVDMLLEDLNAVDMADDIDMQTDMMFEDLNVVDMLTDMMLEDAEVPLPCEEGLIVEPQSISTLPFSLVTFMVQGGSGNFLFEYIDNQSGGLVNESTGAYLAGDISGVVDTLRVKDLDCISEVELEVNVVNHMQVLPERPSIARGQSIQFEVNGGSGDYEFVWREQVSWGQLDLNGTYFSGDTLGQDRVEVHDLQTGEIVLILIDVNTRVSNDITPKVSWIPVGSHYTFKASGGSGVFDFEWRALSNGIQPPILTAGLDEVMVEGVEAGEGVLVARDRFLNSEVQSRVQILQSLQFQATRMGKGHREAKMQAWPDVDGDGINELLLGLTEADVGSVEAGAVYIYGSSTHTVLQRLSTQERNARFGRSFAVGDWNNDGYPDLVVGALQADRSAIDDTGAVYLYEGQENGLVNTEPNKVIYGKRGGGQSGSSLALCDFNGDGQQDLAVGAWVSEIGGQPSNSGMIRVYLNRAGEFLDSEDQELQGQSLTLDESTGQYTWNARAEHRIGYYLSAGDLDGDGRCDLVASSYSTRGFADVNDTGEVQIFKGMETFGDPPLNGPDGGLTLLPVQVITKSATDANGARLGWRTAIADRDGDGHAELFVSQPRSHINANDAGAIFIYEFESLSAEPAINYSSTADATESLAGGTSSEYFGYSLSLGDFDGDGDQDLAVGAYNDEVEGSPSNVGTLRVFLFDEVNQSYETEPAYTMSGLVGSDNFGEAVVILAPDQVAGYAGFDDSLGPQLGRAYWGELVQNEEEQELFQMTALDYPADLGGTRFGSSLDLADHNQDGTLDVLVGAPYLSPQTMPQIRAGGAFRYEMSSTYTGRQEVQHFDGFAGHSGYDLLGDGVKYIGDFDGDGFGDLAVVARTDERPTNFGVNDIADPAGCPPQRNNAGSVFIFLGQADGSFNSEPSFVIYGDLANDNLESLAGIVDFNDDNKSDIYVGARFADPRNESGNQKRDAGRAFVFKGRSAPPTGQRQVICAPDVIIDGANANNHLGWSIVELGDLNGDGCGEIAFGEPEITIEGRNRQGAVHILYGWGPANCYTTPHMTSITYRNGDARFGTSLSRGDFDADGYSDLVVGGFNASFNGVRPGAVWIVRGSQLRELAPRTLSQSRIYHEINPWVGEEGEWWVAGRDNQVRFGWSVAAAGQYLFVTAPIMTDRSQRIGEGYLYELDENGFNRLVGVFVGENQDTFGELGLVSDMHIDPNQGWIGFGSVWGRGTYAQGGSVYIGTFDP